MFSKFENTPFLNVLQREVSRLIKSPVLIFGTVVAPAIAFLLIAQIFSAGVIRNLPVAVVDQDNTPTSRRIARLVDATPVVKTFKVSSVIEAEDMLVKGKTDAIIIIPSKLEADVMKSGSPTIAVYLNNTNVLKGGALRAGLYRTLSTVSAGIKLQSFLRKEMNEYQAMEQVLPVRLGTHALFNPFSNYSYFLTLGLLPLMVNVFTFLVSVYALGIEMKEGTAGKLMETARNRVGIALTGKMLPYTFLFLVSTMFMNIILFRILGTPIKGSLFLIIVSEVLLIVTYQVLALVFLALTSNLRLTLSLGSAYTMMALSFSGLTFPSMAMPAIAKGFSCLFPYTFWLKIFMGQTLRGEPASSTAIPFLIFSVFILSSLFILPKMSVKLSENRYWGKE